MNQSIQFLVRHGSIVLFVTVFIEQVGVPLPSLLWLLAAGGLIGNGQMNLGVAMGAAGLGSLVADLIWYFLGRRYGNRVLGLLCRISLEPDSCVRRTQEVFSRYGIKGVVAAKFVPGLSTLAPPLAGSTGISLGRFLIYDGAGSLLYVGSFIAVGMLFSHQMEQVIKAVSSLGAGALALVVGAAVLYIAYKFYQRKRLLHELRMTRITVDELHARLEAGEKPVILDLRSRAALEEDPFLIAGAIHVSIDEVERRQWDIPFDHDIVIYCSCPNEVSAARAALLMRRKGFSQVRPLLGGIDAWRERKFPVDSPAVETK